MPQFSQKSLLDAYGGIVTATRRRVAGKNSAPVPVQDAEVSVIGPLATDALPAIDACGNPVVVTLTLNVTQLIATTQVTFTLYRDGVAVAGSTPYAKAFPNVGELELVSMSWYDLPPKSTPSPVYEVRAASSDNPGADSISVYGELVAHVA